VANSKIKQLPEDFLVEELSDILPLNYGSFSLYHLEKRNWTTPDALSRVRRHWKVEAWQLSYGGLKDKHAVTQQLFTIKNGPKKNLDLSDVFVKYIGSIPCPYESHHIKANRFTIVIRNIISEQTKNIPDIINLLPSAGIPNYFDDQRFGSIESLNSEFVAKKMVLGNFEEALKLALTSFYLHDNAATKQEKKILKENWGDWVGLKTLLSRGHARSLVDYLIHHPVDFKGTVERLRPELGGLYLSAYQSHLWNIVLARWINSNFKPEDIFSIKLKLGIHPVVKFAPSEMHDLLENTYIPLPSSRLKMQPEDPFYFLINSVLAEEGFLLEKMKIPGNSKMFFSKGERKAFYFAKKMDAEVFDDTLNRNKKAVKIRFDLPKGAYATLLIKCLQTLMWNT